jgi:hypothetical protein
MKPCLSQDLFNRDEWSLYYVDYADGIEITTMAVRGTRQECDEFIERERV